MHARAVAGYAWSMTPTKSDLVFVQARSLATLRLKVAARRATGWVVDGDQLVVTDYTTRRPVKRYTQGMIRPLPLIFHWSAVQ